MPPNPSFPVAIRLTDPSKPEPFIVQARYEPGEGSASGQLRLEPHNMNPWVFANLLSEAIRGDAHADLGFNDGTGDVARWELVILRVTFYPHGALGLVAESRGPAAWRRITTRARTLTQEAQ